jgi:hypothetical protein
MTQDELNPQLPLSLHCQRCRWLDRKCEGRHEDLEEQPECYEGLRPYEICEGM